MNNNQKILLIEDNEQNAYLARFLLVQAGLQVTHAGSGQEGINILKNEPHSVVLLDIQLPDIDGYEVASLLRKDPALNQVAIVALTSFAMAGEREKALAVGCNGYIEKPISPLKFVEQVRSFLKAA